MPRRDPPDRFREAAELLGRKVASVREARSLTQEQLAAMTGISRNQIQNIERNRNNTKDPESGRPGPANARLDTLYLIADALQVEVTWLIDRHDRRMLPEERVLPEKNMRRQR